MLTAAIRICFWVMIETAILSICCATFVSTALEPVLSLPVNSRSCINMFVVVVKSLHGMMMLFPTSVATQPFFPHYVPCATRFSSCSSHALSVAWLQCFLRLRSSWCSLAWLALPRLLEILGCMLHSHLRFVYPVPLCIEVFLLLLVFTDGSCSVLLLGCINACPLFP